MSDALVRLIDTYSLRARLQPALLTLLPLLVTIAAWFPALHEAAAGLVGLAAACGLTMLLAQIARLRGRKVEQQLFKVWGGKPTTIWLRLRDNNLDSHTKARYHTCLQERIPGWEPPTLEEEDERFTETDARYDSAVRWLRERARDKTRFPIVFQENVGYGFRRNLYGLKPIGIVVAVLAVGVNALMLHLHLNNTATGSAFPVVGLATFAFGIFALVAWLVVASPAWVRDAGDAYARALLSICDEASSTIP